MLGSFKRNLLQTICDPLINIGIPLSLMGILLKSGVEWPLIQAALLALVAITLSIAILNCLPVAKKYIPNRSLQLGSGFGNTGYFGIPVSLALLPNHSLIYRIGFDIGATLVIWSLGPILLTKNENELNLNRYRNNIIEAISSSPAIKGLIGALINKSSPLNEQITALLWIPSRIMILLALVIVRMNLSWLRKSNLSKIKPK